MTMTPPIILDIEASGFGADSYPIEIGYADVHGCLWHALVQPQPTWQHWDADAERLHQHTRQSLVLHGQSAREVAGQLNQALRGHTAYSDGWYQDYVWLHRLFEAADMTPAFKLEDLRLILSPQQKAHWHATKQRLATRMALPPHRAASDARILQMTWLESASASAFSLAV